MNKNYFKLFIALCCLLSFSAINAQTYTHGDVTVNVMPSMTHDSTLCHSSCNIAYSITIGSSFVGDSVKIIDTVAHALIHAYGNTTGASPWTVIATIPMYTPIVLDNALAGTTAVFNGPTVKVISDTDTITGITNIYLLPVTNPCGYGNVSGTVYIDNNSNCIYDAGDVPLNGIMVTSTAALSSPSSSWISAIAYSGATGTYSLSVQSSWMTSYTVGIPSAYAFIFPVTPCFSGSYTFTTLPQTNVGFPLQCTSNIDVMCYALSAPDVRVATPFFMEPFVSNTGCDSASGQLVFVKDSRVIYDPSLSYNPAITVSGDTLVWNYTNLTNLTDGAYWNSYLSRIHLAPDSTVVVGDTLCFRVYTNILPGDINPGNNDYTICLPVVYSYDPNLKEVTPKGTGTPGYIPASTDTLTYTLHFQNTGTATAYNVSIIDTLDDNIVPSSLKILGTSHTMNPEWLAPGVVKFNFDNIYLPDSTDDEAASHGSVRFMVRLNAALPAGTQIKNKGYIYFDTNPAVITNTTLNTIAPDTSSTTNASHTIASGNNLVIYPNPATDYIFVENLQNGTISIQNINGSVIMQQETTNDKTRIDISKLPGGIYILKCISQNETTITKFTKY